MNFFEHQDRARRNTRTLVVLFTLAVIAIVVAMNALVLVFLGGIGMPEQGEEWLGREFLTRNLELVVWTTLITTGVIGLASLYRSMGLRSGGSDVARSLGGTPIEPDTTDPLKRRLRNVVEEMAIAAGVPVPDIFVLEREQGINAFAAGYSPADAAVAVTRGTLEKLNRDELQGVIAHEFSHILNGDMRLNIRLIGILFGILVMAIIGRRVLMTARYGGDSRNTAPIVLIGLLVMIVGYIGLFFGRWIKAAVSRQREYLADASAVQFTRMPDGIAGALKKIAASYEGSFMVADTEEVGHMLFGRGMGSQMFATHPPVERRIQAIEPGFRMDDLKDVAASMKRHAEARKAAAESDHGPAGEREDGRGPGGLPLDPAKLIESIGQPGLSQVLIAAALAAAIPKPLERAAHSLEWAPEVLCYLLLSSDGEIREKQLLMIAEALGAESERQVRALVAACPDLPEAQRLPLLEITFPALRRRPEQELVGLMGLMDRLIHADGQVDVFEYALARLTARQLQDALHPERVRSGGHKSLQACRAELIDLIAIVAMHGHAGENEAAAAFRAGLNGLILPVPDDPPVSDQPWHERLDEALRRLDHLTHDAKRRLVEALARCVLHDGQVVRTEYELIRAVCASLHVPLPVLDQQQ